MKQGNVGNIQVLQSMRAAVQQQRAAGQNTVPIAWVDSWIAQLDAEYAYPYPYGAPFSPYSFVDFHPISTFLPLFATNERVTFTSTVK
jgi:hypothetical protein